MEENEEQTNNAPVLDEPRQIPQEYTKLFEVGAHFGHQKSRVHPSMFPYIFGVRNGVHIIDVEKTSEMLDRASAFLTEQTKAGKTVLFVGTKVPVREIVKDAAERSGMYHMVERWPGGVLTNWKTFSNTLAHLAELEEKKKSEEWEKYTKYERMMMDREMAKLNLQWGGVKGLKKVPDVMVVVDMNHDHLAVAEAKKLGIVLMAITDTNVNASLADYPIPASDDSVKTTAYVLDHFVAAIVDGKKQAEDSKTQ